MVKIIEKYKTNPVVKGIATGLFAVSGFFIHELLGIFMMISLITLYEYLENMSLSNKTGRDSFYLTVFIAGALFFGLHIYENLSI